MNDNNELIDQHYCFWAVLCLLIKYSTTISFSTTYRTLKLSPKEISQKSSWARSPYWFMEFSTIQFRVHLEFLYEKKFFLLPIPVNKEWRNGDNTEISKWIKIEKGKYGRYTAVSHTIVGAPYPKDRKDVLVRHWFCSLEELSFFSLSCCLWPLTAFSFSFTLSGRIGDVLRGHTVLGRHRVCSGSSQAQKMGFRESHAVASPSFTNNLFLVVCCQRQLIATVLV